jgi:hypothetical protein
MVKIDKTPWIGGALDHRHLKEPERKQLDNDCCEKCYICEDKPKHPGELTLEHIVSQQAAPELANDWNNWLRSCERCNHAKGSSFDDIINPIITDPEQELSLTVGSHGVTVKAKTDSPSTASTVRLLKIVYAADYDKLNKKIQSEVRDFQLYIDYYQEYGDDYADCIVEAIARSSIFAAFKRQIVREDSDLCAKFGECL